MITAKWIDHSSILSEISPQKSYVMIDFTHTHTQTQSQTFKHTLGRIMVVNIQKQKQEKQVLNTICIYNFVKYILWCNQIHKKKPQAAEYKFE